MKRSLLLSTAALAIAMLPTGAAQAQNALDWAGPYIGAHAGFLSGNVDIDEYDEVVVTGDISGFVGGVLAGQNFAHGPFVLGVEADFGLSNADGNGTPDAALELFTYDLDWDAHLRARAGVPMGGVMPFAAIGLALADLSVSGDGSAQQGGVFTGLSLGAGIDVRLGPNGVLRVEGLYDTYGSKDYDFDEEPYGVDFSAWTARVAAIFELP